MSGFFGLFDFKLDHWLDLTPWKRRGRIRKRIRLDRHSSSIDIVFQNFLARLASLIGMHRSIEKKRTLFEEGIDLRHARIPLWLSGLHLAHLLNNNRLASLWRIEALKQRHRP